MMTQDVTQDKPIVRLAVKWGISADEFAALAPHFNGLPRKVVKTFLHSYAIHLSHLPLEKRLKVMERKANHWKSAQERAAKRAAARAAEETRKAAWDAEFRRAWGLQA